MRDAFDIYLVGEPRGLKTGIAKQLHAGLTARQLVPVIRRLISVYQEAGKKKERYSRFVERMTVEKLRELTQAELEAV